MGPIKSKNFCRLYCDESSVSCEIVSVQLGIRRCAVSPNVGTVELHKLQILEILWRQLAETINWQSTKEESVATLLITFNSEFYFTVFTISTSLTHFMNHVFLYPLTHPCPAHGPPPYHYPTCPPCPPPCLPPPPPSYLPPPAS